jgi:hypothetical protein
VGLVRDLLGEVVGLAEHFADDGTVSSACDSSLQKTSVFGTHGAAGEEVGGEGFLVGLDDGADLRLHHHGAVELLGSVGEVFVEVLPADLARLLASLVDVVALLDLAAGFGNLGLDSLDVVADVHLMGDRAFVSVVRPGITGSF